MLQRVYLTLAILLVAGYGVAEALWSERWFTTPVLREASDKLAAVPSVIGPWQGDDRELDDRQARQGEIKASLVRTYTNSETGAMLTVMVVAGRSGPICVHSPETCLGGGGYALASPAVRATIETESPKPTFWHGVFNKGEAVVPESVEMYWSWNPGTGWRAASSPRWDFARDRALFKVYVSRSLNPALSRDGDESPIPAFLQRFLPEVERALFAAP